MLGYFDVFPDKTKTELRTVTLSPVNAGEVDPLEGTFLFTEYFCTDPDCDCQRVLVKVFRVESLDERPVEVATISYSWKPNSDETWTKINSEMPNPFLDPFHRQAPYADELLDFWSEMMDRDSAYASRIQRHYDEIRAEVGTEDGEAPQQWAQPSTGNKTLEILSRPLTKQSRKVRQKRLVNARKRKRTK